MNWYQAKAHCRSKGMRLPTIDELKAANASKGGLRVPGKLQMAGIGGMYWSSLPVGVDDGDVNDNSYVFFDFENSVVGQPRRTFNSVRCVSR